MTHASLLAFYNLGAGYHFAALNQSAFLKAARHPVPQQSQSFKQHAIQSLRAPRR